MHLLKIALLQIAPCGTLNENLEKAYSIAEKRQSSARILLCSPKCGAMGIIYMTDLPKNGRPKQFLPNVIL